MCSLHRDLGCGAFNFGKISVGSRWHQMTVTAQNWERKMEQAIVAPLTQRSIEEAAK